MQKYIALVDCNNFFVSCERLSRPDLMDKPVVVLSSNDGCVISRSNEAKKRGIPMGVPWFKIRNAPYCQDVAVFSSDIPFYSEISQKIKKIMSRFTPVQEAYSIDESFLDLTGFDDIRARAYAIRDAILQEAGIPVCVGMGPTKTLAKLANFIAKKHPRSSGVFTWHVLTDEQKERLLKRIPVGEVWGIGKQYARALENDGIQTAAQLKLANRPAMRARFGVVMDRLIAELRGIPCLALSDMQPPRKQMVSSRSFGKPITACSDLENAVAYHVTHLGRQLREEGTVAGQVQVFLSTDPYRHDLPQYHPEVVLPFATPTSSTLEINRYAIKGLHRIFRAGFAYHKSGVGVLNIVPASDVLPDLFADHKEEKLMAAMDAINQRFGENALRLAQNDPCRRNWQPKKAWLASRHRETQEAGKTGGRKA